MITTNDFLTALECTKFIFSLGSTPDPAGGAYSAPPYPLGGLTGAILLREWEGRQRKNDVEGREGDSPL